MVRYVERESQSLKSPGLTDWQLVEASDGGSFVVYNPASGDKIAEGKAPPPASLRGWLGATRLTKSDKSSGGK